MLKISYIFHSSFMVTAPECRILFDFRKDPLERLPDMLLDDDLPVYILVSHFHKDHYNPEIFRWAERRGNMRFILSKDTAKRARHFFSSTSTHSGPHLPPEMLTVMQEGEVYSDDLVTIRAFGSTDIGNSYLVETTERRIFHAGDLNAWIWKDESTEKEVEQALDLFRQKLRALKKYLGKGGKIDIAMFPVDSRIGTEYWTGAEIFLREFNIDYFLPMHFGLGDEDEQAARRLDAVCVDKYADSSYPTVFVGPLAPHGVLAIPANHSGLEK